MKLIVYLTVLLLPTMAIAEHPGCVVRDDPHMTCTAGTAWDAEIAGCMPIISG